jgi:hypothetical protein
VSMRIRMGPVSVSSKGRVGVRAGPVSVYGGGRRRRSRRRSSSSGGGGGALIALLGFILVLGLAVEYWYIVVPVLVVVLVVAVAGSNQKKQRAAEQAAAAKQARAAAVQARIEAQHRWLEGPPPVLRVPGRFTENWFAANVPSLHPGQVPALLDELHERGWTDQRIEKRVRPYLLRNRFYTESR